MSDKTGWVDKIIEFAMNPSSSSRIYFSKFFSDISSVISFENNLVYICKKMYKKIRWIREEN